MSTVSAPSETSGHECRFVNTLHERYICKICLYPCKDPYLSGCCGHNFCKSCLDNAKKINNSCPLCQNKELASFPNIQADREIIGFGVMCTNEERGCEWQGKLNDLNSHLGNSSGCQFEDVKCFNECGKMLQRQYLTSHIVTGCPCRIVDCQYCHITGEHQFIKGVHKEQCPKLPLPCPNKCRATKIAREDMEAHRKECSLEVVQCEYHNVGCEETMIRAKKRKHEWNRMEDHLLMTKFQLHKADNKLASTETRLCNAEVMLHHLIKNSGHSRTLIDSTHWPIRLTTMTTKVTGVAKTCPVVIKMTKFTSHKEEKVCWQSEPFFSHIRGYKMYLIVYAAGNDVGKGTHLSMALYLMKGPHDDELTWPLKETFGVTLLNQISDQEHFTGIIPYSNCNDRSTIGRVIDDGSGKGWGKAKFISNEDLNKVTSTCQYLSDDCIFLRVSKL
ncbi:TNF receptor-associated factor 4-like [Dysidea avara]|uniref:TNF receptor-associated factor 4-like n=1 Tax=Dysidea avara TaxID=196820 RepID=UPI003319ED2E